MAFVKFRLFADASNNGATITVVFDDTPANEPFIRSIVSLGHEVMSQDRLSDPSSTPNADPQELASFIIKVQVNK